MSCLVAILLTRVYALWGRSRFILWGLLTYYFCFAGFAAVRYSVALRHTTLNSQFLSGRSPEGGARLLFPWYRRIHWGVSVFYRRKSTYELAATIDQLTSFLTGDFVRCFSSARTGD